jgi:hypothetical protein
MAAKLTEQNTTIKAINELGDDRGEAGAALWYMYCDEKSSSSVLGDRSRL